MPFSLVRKSEEPEEDDRANDQQPPSELNRHQRSLILGVENSWELDHLRVVEMGVCPALVWHDSGCSGYIQVDGIGRDGDCAAELDASKRHETEVSAVGQVLVGGDQVFELLAPFHEGHESQNTVDGRNESDDERP